MHFHCIDHLNYFIFKRGIKLEIVCNTWHLMTTYRLIYLMFLRFFEDLDTRHQKHPVIKDISDIVNKYATQHFEPYIVYCSNETFQQRTLQKLQ